MRGRSRIYKEPCAFWQTCADAEEVSVSLISQHLLLYISLYTMSLIITEVYGEAIGTVGMAGLVGRGRAGINRGAGSHGGSCGEKGSGGQTFRVTGPGGIAGGPGEARASGGFSGWTDIPGRWGASSTAGSTDVHHLHPADPELAHRPHRRRGAAARPHHLHGTAHWSGGDPRRPRHGRDPGGWAVAQLDHVLLAASARPLDMARRLAGPAEGAPDAVRPAGLARGPR